MPTKEEMEEELNEKLDTDIEWSELRKGDIMELLQMIDNGELMNKLMKYMVSRYGRDELDRRIKGWQPGDLIKKVI